MKKTITFFPTRAAIILLATLLLTLTAQTAWAQTQSFPTSSGGNGTSADPYKITTASDLIALAADVNSGTDYSGMYFKVMNTITFTHTSNWNNTSSNEHNFDGIGNHSYNFKGKFDGNHMTIRGIRIYKGGNNVAEDGYKGLFGNIGWGAEIKDLTLSDTRITAYQFAGGIVGNANGGAAINNCHVDNTVQIHAVQNYAHFHGGIAGQTSRNITNCTSSVTLSVAGTSNKTTSYGGIVGKVTSSTVISDNLVTNATIPNVINLGAIIGESFGNVYRNYYLGCTVAGVSNATGVGCKNGDIDGAATSLHTLAFSDGVSTSTSPTKTISSVGYYAKGTAITLSCTPSAGNALLGYTSTPAVVTFSGNTFTMPGANVTIGAAFISEWTGTGDDADHPYIIADEDHLDLLAFRVNCGESYTGKFFELGDDINYNTTDDWGNLSGIENNYTAIGNSSNVFDGTFDGKNHTISGIRIYKSGTDDADSYQGLFGQLGGSATVKRVTLANTRITSFSNTGGIAGYNQGSITDCHVAANVTLLAEMDGTHYYNHRGGIAGSNYGGTVSYCTSSVKLRATGTVRGENHGCIVGTNTGSVNHCLAIGANVSLTTNNMFSGTIVGYMHPSKGSLSNNYYVNCTFTSDYGIGSSSGEGTHKDVPGQAEPAYELSAAPALLGSGTGDGAVKAYGNYGLGYNSKYYLVLIPLSETEGVTYLTTNFATATAVPVEFTRTFTSGQASTVCLPFDYTPGTEGTYYTFSGVSKNGENKWTATMSATAATLSANTPYLFVPAAGGDVPFSGICATTISAASEASGDWSFVGTYAAKTWTAGETNDYGFAAQSGTAAGSSDAVNAGDFVHLTTGASIKPFRAYLRFTGSTLPWASSSRRMTRGEAIELPKTISVVLVSANGNTTEIGTLDTRTGEIIPTGEWYSLDGTRLSGKPSAKGVYVNNGKKIVIK